MNKEISIYHNKECEQIKSRENDRLVHLELAAQSALGINKNYYKNSELHKEAQTNKAIYAASISRPIHSAAALFLCKFQPRRLTTRAALLLKVLAAALRAATINHVTSLLCALRCRAANE